MDATTEQTTRTYWHVAAADYEPGDDLLSWDRQVERGYEPVWKWEPDQLGLDADCVCLFRERADADAFMAEWLPAGVLVRVDLPEDVIASREVAMIVNAEGYDAVLWSIPAAYLTVEA